MLTRKKDNYMRTTENVLELGLYASVCCGHDRIFDKLDVFQRCPDCQGLCEWELVEPVVDYTELELEAA
jgi:hypothetical protein